MENLLIVITVVIKLNLEIIHFILFEAVEDFIMIRIHFIMFLTVVIKFTSLRIYLN